MPKCDHRDLARLLAAKAAGDEVTLEELIAKPNVPDEVLGFHAQQAVEKLLKAVLAWAGGEPPRSHDIGYLVMLLDEHGAPLPPAVEELKRLNPWAAEFRYEDATAHALERDSAAELVRAVRAWAGEILSGETGAGPANPST